MPMQMPWWPVWRNRFSIFHMGRLPLVDFKIKDRIFHADI